MRKWLIRAGISAVVASACVSAGACGGDDSNGTGGDSGAGDGTTTDVVSTKDSGSDAGADAKAPGPATLTVLQNGTAYAGAKVVFYDGTGAPQPLITTGADGKATMTVSTGWSVTGSVVLPGSTSQTQLLSFLDIEPGDDLVMTSETEKSKAALVAVDEPTGAISGIDSVIYSAGCGSQSYSDGTPGNAIVTGPCLHALGDGGSTFDVLVTAIDANQNTIAYAQMTNVAYTGSGEHLTGLTWSTATNVPVAFTGSPPASAVSLGAQTTFVGSGLAFGSSDVSANADAGTPSFALGTPVGSFANQASLQFGVQFGPILDGFAYVTHRALANDSASYPVDFGALAPALQSGTLTSDDGGGVSFAVTSAAPLSGYDGEIISLYFYKEVGDSGTYDTAFWSVVSPASTSIVPPKLTSDLTAFVPAMANMYLTGFYVQKATTLGSYAAYRKGYARYPFNAPDLSAPFTIEETGIFVPN